MLDAFQLCLILCVPQFGLPSLKTAEILAGVYVFFLFIDFGYLFRVGRILNLQNRRFTRIRLGHISGSLVRPMGGAGITYTGAMSRRSARAREVLGPPPAVKCAGGPLSD